VQSADPRTNSSRFGYLLQALEQGLDDEDLALAIQWGRRQLDLRDALGFDPIRPDDPVRNAPLAPRPLMIATVDLLAEEAIARLKRGTWGHKRLATEVFAWEQWRDRRWIGFVESLEPPQDARAA
jgi:hypothetical protein